MNSDLISHFLARINQSQRVTQALWQYAPPSPLQTGQSTPSLGRLTPNREAEPKPGNQEKTRQREKPSGLVMGLA